MRICDPMLPVLAVEFDASLAAVAATTTGFAIAYGVAQLVFGPLGDRVGRLPVIVVAIAFAAVASGASALAPTLSSLVAARIATGAFAAAAIPLSLGWIGDNVVFSDRQPVLARYLIGQMLGMTAGQIGGGVLSDLIGWRAGFWIIAVLFAVASVLLLRRTKSTRLSSPSRDGRPAPEIAPAVSTPAVCTSAPQSAPRPAIREFLHQSRRLFADRWAATVIITVALEGVLLFGAVALLASFLQQDFGVSPSIAGTVTAVYGLGGLLYAVNARRLIGRLGPAGLAACGGALCATALGLLILQPSWQPAIFASLIVGLGYYMLHNTLQTQATQLSSEARGAAIAWFASGLWLGQGIGVSAAAAVAERYGFRIVFGAAAIGLIVLGLNFGRALRRRASAGAA